MAIQCTYMYIHCAWVPHSVCIYHYGIYHWGFACTADEADLNNSMVQVLQESAIMYKQASDRGIPPKNGIYPLKCMYMNKHIQCTDMYIICI
jgi:hypothetical protein